MNTISLSAFIKQMMKKILLPAIAFIALMSIASCSEDFKIAAPYKNITVVYGLLDQADTAHYIRIEKAFLDQNKSAVTMAQNPDSIYFPNLNVRIDVLSGSTVIRSIPLKKVDLNAEGYPRESGSFPNSPNYAYKFTDHLDGGSIYRLVINNPVTGETDSAETQIIDEDPSGYTIPFFSVLLPFSIARTSPNNTFTVNGNLPAGTATVQGVIRFHWVDKDASGKETDQYGDWPFANQVLSGTLGFNLTVKNSDFYYAMHNIIGPAPAGISRLIDSSDMYLYLGSSDLYTYQQITAVQNSGLTGDEIKPNYTNMKGANVLGMFTARGVLTDHNIPFDNEAVDSLMTNPITVPIDIQGRSDH